MDINKYAAKMLKQLRLEKKMTQEELAKQLNITQQQVARYENNLRQFKQDFLFKLADYFKVSINEFFPPSVENYLDDALSSDLKDNNMTPLQLAVKSNVNLSNISNIINQKNKLPKPKDLIKICEAINVDPIEYFTFAGYIEDPEGGNNELYDSGIRFLLDENDKIDLCKYLANKWSNCNWEEIYNQLFQNEKESFSKKDVKTILNSNSISETNNFKIPIEDLNLARKINDLPQAQKEIIINMINALFNK